MKQAFKSLLTPITILAILGGCTAVTEGPKFLWGANAQRKAKELGWVCLGQTKVGQLINPLTWFVTGPNTYWFAKPAQVKTQKYLRDVWVVQTYRVNHEDGQTVGLSLLDTDNERWAYLGDPETDQKSELTRNFDNPKWEDAKTLKDHAWFKNAMDWIKNGKPSKASYCD